MTCKDCLHYEVCMDFTHLKESEFAQSYDQSDLLCEHFKNKADVVEVVRCKDCKHFVSGICRQDLALDLACGDDYCSYGERSDT